MAADFRRAGWSNWAAAQAMGAGQEAERPRPVRREGAAAGRSHAEVAAEIGRLQAEKARAVEEEEYEEAAVLKRRIQAMEAVLRELPGGGEEQPSTAASSPQQTQPAAVAEPPLRGGPALGPQGTSRPPTVADEAAGPAAPAPSKPAVAGASVRPAGPDGSYEVVHERLAVRSGPSTKGDALTVVKHGKVVFGTPYDIDGNPWLRLDSGTCEELEIREDSSWVLMHGRCVGLGELLRRQPAESEEPTEPAQDVVSKSTAGQAGANPVQGFGHSASSSYSAYRTRNLSDSEGSEGGPQGGPGPAGPGAEDEWDAVNQRWRGDSDNEYAKPKPDETTKEGEDGEEEDWDEEWEEGDEEWWDDEEWQEGEAPVRTSGDGGQASDEANAAGPGGVGRRESTGGSRPSSGPGPPPSSRVGRATQAAPAVGSQLPLAELERYSEGIEAAQQAGNETAALKLLKSRGDLYRAHGEFDLALADAEASVELAPEDPEAYVRRAVARLEAGGQDQQALADLRAAQRLGLSDSRGPMLDKWIRRAKNWMGQRSRKNHYRALGAPADSTAEQVKQAYRKAALRWHPDKPGGDVERFRAVQEAWEVLGDADRRRAYDFGNTEPAARRAASGAGRSAPGSYVPSAGFFVPPPRQTVGRMPPGGFYVPPSKYSSGGSAAPGYAQGGFGPRTVTFSNKNGNGPRMSYMTGRTMSAGFAADRA
uniref:J domain-containing protein n=1 Tax=Alexandrium monilatum TaxID=311494 RepID=A0A7S4Q2Y2_9DINO